MREPAVGAVQEIEGADALETSRGELDRIDEELLAALAARVAVCRRIAHHKRHHGVPMMQPHRIDVVQQRAARYAQANGLDPAFVKALYDLIIAETCRIEDLIIDAAGSTDPCV